MTTDGSASQSPTPLSESPWFWAYLFGSAALIALFVAGTKFGPRQAQIEREFQARTRATQQLNGQEPTVPMSTADRTIVTLQPLWILLTVITIVGWLLFWRSRRVAAISSPSSQNSSPPSSSSSHHVDSGQPV